jgi:hypothetical protein
MDKHARLLFIGNSYTHCNELPKTLERLVLDAALPPVTTVFSGEGGWTFEKHWEAGAAHRLLEAEQWTHMVLQEQTRRPYEDTTRFREYALRFHEVAKSRGIQTVLYLTWAPEKEPDKQALLNKAYRDLGRDTGAEIVPSGLAFERLQGAGRKIDLFVEDRRHPSAIGSYLSACCFFSWLTGASPEGRTSKVAANGQALNCDGDDVLLVQKTAWTTWCDWQAGKIE